MSSRNLADWISLNMLPGIGPILARRALRRFGDPGRIAHIVPERELRAMPGAGRRLAGLAEARRNLARRAERELRRAERLGIRVLVAQDPDYPAALAELVDAPILLYVRGELRAGVTRVAVVGSRRASRYGRQMATGLGSGLASREVEVVSGGARGIDTCAHLGALEEGGRTIAVLGSGLARPYPAENEALFDRIAGQGALISEFPLELPPQPEHFPRRNRVISGLTSAVIVVEAARRSGSLVTAGHALEQGREVLAVPGPVTSSLSAGTHLLIQQGAKLVQNLSDVVEELSPMYRGAVTPAPVPSPPAELTGLLPDERAMLVLLDDVEPTQVDELAENAPFGFARVQAALFGLQLHGAVEAIPGGYYLRKVPVED